MINFHYEMDFQLSDEANYTKWISALVASEQKVIGTLDYIFCTDEYLLRINQEYLNHDTYTDIITFDYTEGKAVAGDVFISVDRLLENSRTFETEFEDELLRVMAHGVLHLMGYKDKTEREKELMRSKENDKIRMFHVEQ